MDDVVDGSLVIQRAGRRNRNYKVYRRGRSGLFVKQVPVVVTETVASILQEAQFYQLAYQSEAFEPLRPHLLELYDYDARIHALTLSLVPDCENLTQLRLRLGSLPSGIARSLGRVLGTAHLSGARLVAGGVRDAGLFPGKRPWIFDVAQHAETLFGAHPSGGTQQLVATLRQTPALVAALAQLGNEWRTISLHHGDIKWDNFVVCKDASLEDASAVRLVDWELSDLGDPGWDVGALLASFVQFWVATMSPDASQLDDLHLVLNAPLKLDDLWPAVVDFWLSYSDTVGLAGAEAASELERHVRFAGARLALSAFEVAHPAAAAGRTAHMFLRLAVGILSDPGRACRELFGLDPVRQQLCGTKSHRGRGTTNQREVRP